MKKKYTVRYRSFGVQWEQEETKYLWEFIWLLLTKKDKILIAIYFD